MSNEIQTMKRSNILRKVSKDSLRLEELPLYVKKYLVQNPFLTSNCQVKTWYYNGGGKLVNYGINSFIRDIYFFFDYNDYKYAIYSDRFGKYYSVTDTKVLSILTASNLYITNEGILLFYTDKTIYATLNCKVGCIVDIDLLLHKTDSRIVNIITLNNKTIIKAEYSQRMEIGYYLITFSLRLYESYGTQIEVNVNELISGLINSDETSDSEFLDEYCDVDFDLVEIKKANRILELYGPNETQCKIKDFKNRLGKCACCKEREKLSYTNKEIIKFDFISHRGDTGIDDCINSFVNEIYLVKPKIVKRIGFFEKEIFEKYVLIQNDRFYFLHVHTDISKHTFKNILDSTLFVSLEGVIIALNSSSILISLDGIIWKSYAYKYICLKDTLDYICSYEFSCEDGKNILTLKKIKNSGKEVSWSFIVDFKFNFWDLYSSPVEADFTLIN